MYYPKKEILLILLFFPFCSIAGETYSDEDGQRVEFSSFAGEDLWGSTGEEISAHGILYLPDLTGERQKVPLAILISGMGGQRGRDNRLCTVLSQNGIACFGVRTYASRGLEHKLRPSQKIKVASIGARLHDAYGALEHFKNHPAIDKSRIWQIGFSLGGLVSAFAIDPAITVRFQRSESDFKGFIALYSSCLRTNTHTLKSTQYHLFVGDADIAYNEEECEKFIRSINDRGVDGHLTLFESPNQWTQIGHQWDNMQALVGGWHGKPEGPWRLHSSDGKVYSQSSISAYGCNFVVDPARKLLKAKSQTIVEPTDNELWDFVMAQCGKGKTISANRHKITKTVDEHLIRIISE